MEVRSGLQKYRDTIYMGDQSTDLEALISYLLTVHCTLGLQITHLVSTSVFHG